MNQGNTNPLLNSLQVLLVEELQDLLVIHAHHLLSLLRQNLLHVGAVVVEVPQVIRNEVEIIAAGTTDQDDTMVVRLLAHLSRCTCSTHLAGKHDDHHVVCCFRTRDRLQYLLQITRHIQRHILASITRFLLLDSRLGCRCSSRTSEETKRSGGEMITENGSGGKEAMRPESKPSYEKRAQRGNGLGDG